MSTRDLFERRQAERRPNTQCGPPEKICVLLNRGGLGDTVAAIWIAHATRERARRVVLSGSGQHLELLNLFGIPSAKLHTGQKYRHVGHFFQNVNRHQWVQPFLEFWNERLKLGLSDFPRPPHTLTSAELRWDEEWTHGLAITLCPRSTATRKEWPPELCRQLVERLQADGQRVVIATVSTPWLSDLPNYMTGLTLRELAAVLVTSRAVIAVDSMPAHLAGTLGVPTVCLLGPTTDSLFAHLPSVHCVSTRRSVMPCVGCWMHAPWQRAVCKLGCLALSNLSVEDVYAAVCAVAGNLGAPRYAGFS